MSGMPGWITDLVCFGIAFLIAIVAIYVDCYQIVRKIIWSVPRQFYTSPAILLLAACGGLIAGICYLFADPRGDGYVSKLLTLSIENPYLRAANVGVLVLVLIRSRLFQLQGADFGGEFFYSEARVRAVAAVILSWAQYRETFLSRNIQSTFAVPDYAEKVLDRIAFVMKGADDDHRRSVESQIGEIRRDAPTTPRNAGDRVWQTYHRTVTSLALTNCGAAALKDLGVT